MYQVKESKQTWTADSHNKSRGGPFFNPVFESVFIVDLL